jgi:hypothetical protein
MPKRDRAAYMREYRKRARPQAPPNGTTGDLIGYLEVENERLTAEVARLKRELAARPVGPAFNSRPFTPVPKK